ncbi:MAG TPA: hypothetical protein VMU83_24755 [Hanamia sp.]|nr:hypothetical protein [Hanamia sp.]
MNNRFKFLTILFAFITLSALIVHLFELGVKINLSKEDYHSVQNIYREWAWLGVFEIGSILLTAILTFKERENKKIFPYLMISFVCFLVSIIFFFLFTFPVNGATSNWTQMPQGWDILRRKWEYSHAINATLYLTGFGFLIGAVLSKRQVE